MRMRWSIGAALLVWAAPLASQAPPRLEPGTRVRISWRGERTRMAGVLREVRGDTLVVYDSATGGEAVARLEWLRTVEVSKGSRSGWAGTVTGAIVGGGVGALFGAALPLPELQRCDSCLNIMNLRIPRSAVVVLAAAVGAMVGGAIGHALDRAERWVAVPLERVRVGVTPMPSGRLGVGLTVGLGHE